MDQTKDTLKLIGKQNGVSEQAVESCEKDQTLLDKLSADQKFAFEVLKVDATPTFFINGEIRKGASDLPAAWPYVGGCNSLTSQPTSPDFIGSDAIAIFST